MTDVNHNTDGRTYKAIFFDMDGTLLPMDTDEFLQAYFKEITCYFADLGYENPKELLDCVLKGTMAACKPHPDVLNAGVFWQTFSSLSGISRKGFEDRMQKFYEGPYNNIGKDLESCSTSAAILRTLKEKGYPLYLTTMPLFPSIAVTQRLRWVGIDAGVFEYLTTYENSYEVKPSLDYYRRVIDRAGVLPKDVLMVGNHTTEDLAILELGCDAYLVCDHLIDKVSYDLSTVKHGSLQDFYEFVLSLPAIQK